MSVSVLVGTPVYAEALACQVECLLNPVEDSHRHDYVPLNGSSSSLFFSAIGKSGNVA